MPSDSKNPRIAPLYSRRTALGALALLGFSAIAATGCHEKGDVIVGGSFLHGGGNPEQVIISIPPRFEPKEGFDPLMNWGWIPAPHKPLIQSTLVSYEQGVGFVGDLAESFSCDDKGRSWTFSLRGDASFTNGRQVSAEDVVFTLNSLLSSTNAKADLSSVDSIEALDSNKVVIRLAKPDYSLLATLCAIGIVPSTEYGESYGKNPIGSGMYKLTQWESKVRAIFDYNEGYYGNTPTIRRIIVVFDNGNRSYSHSRTGDLDIGYLDIEATSPEVVYGDPRTEILPNGLALSSRVPEGYAFAKRKAVDVIGLHLPNSGSGASARNDLTNDRSVRQAISLSIDRRELVLEGLLGCGCPATSACDYQEWSIGPLEEGEFDLERARRILDDAGWDSVDVDGIRTKAGKRAMIVLSYADTDTVMERIALLIKKQIELIGIQVMLLALLETSDTAGVDTNATLTRFGSLYPWEMMSCSTNENAPRELQDLASDVYSAQTYSEMTSAVQAYQKMAMNYDDQTYIWLVNINHDYYQRQNLHALAEPLLPKFGGWGMLEHVDDWSWD